MLSDFHLHTEFSGDSDTPPDQQIEQALALGMRELCVTDHHDFDTQGPALAFLLDIERYFPAVLDAQRRYEGRIRVNAGIELGLQLHVREQVEQAAASQPFDFIVGSSHFVDGKDPYEPSCFAELDERAVYERFFAVTLRRIQQFDCFDVLGHLDYVVRYGPHRNRFYSYDAYREYIDPILKALLEKGKGLECNTGGLRAGLGHPNPTEDILRRYRELGGEILTVGSDAHVPQHLGYGFSQLPELLKDCGFRYYTVFHARRPEFIPL